MTLPSPASGGGQGGGWTAEFPLLGPAGEVIDLRRVFLSHGIAELPPMRLDQKAWTFEITVPLDGIGARTLMISQTRPGQGLISVTGPSPTPQVAAAIMAQVRHVLSLDLDLTPFYAVAAEDPDLAWVLTGAGRMVRSPTVFEDVVKTICTTNTSWGGTTRMVNALVQHLGEKAPGAPADSPYGRAFPTPAAMAAALMLARYDRLILDSWTRPTYARLLGRKRPISDRAIERRFKRYGPYAGLAFWLFLTRDWVPDDTP